MMTSSRTVYVRSLLLALLVATITTKGCALSPASIAVSRGTHCSTLSSTQTIGKRSFGRLTPLFLSESTEEEADPKTKLALDLQRLFDIDQMAYTVMVREEQKGAEGKLTPEELISAIQKDGMFGEDVEEYIEKHASEGDVKVLDIGKFSDDMESSEPLPKEDNLTIPGKGNYLVYLSFAEGICATMRVVVD